MNLKNLFGGTFNNLPVLLTGHTGFKGSWLTIWLKEMGAKVIGYSLEQPPTSPSNYEITRIGQQITDIRGDIRDYEAFRRVVEEYKPILVIHFAAQTTVLDSYNHPKVSFDTNTGGTVNVLEAIRTTDSVKAVVVCTTDKVYENKEWIWGYRENDQLGGYDAYSTSKAMAELVVTAYQRSFFSSANNSTKRGVAVGTVRSGNVVGGGDFTTNGLIADSMRALMAGKQIPLRNPYSVRPWLYVLDTLSGYLSLSAQLLQESGQQYAEAWNFGPLQHKGITTQVIVESLIKYWGVGAWSHFSPEVNASDGVHHETDYLHVNWDKAASRLGWRPVVNLDKALQETVNWYLAYQNHQDMYQDCLNSIYRYSEKAIGSKLEWTLNQQP